MLHVATVKCFQWTSWDFIDSSMFYETNLSVLRSVTEQRNSFRKHLFVWLQQAEQAVTEVGGVHCDVWDRKINHDSKYTGDHLGKKGKV